MKSFLIAVAAMSVMAGHHSLAGDLIKNGSHRIYSGDGDYLVILHGWTTDYLSEHRPANLGKVVMLAPPNKGIEIIDRLGKRPVLAKFFGSTALELQTGENSWPNSLGRADFPLGIIMGSAHIPYTSRVLPGDDDGIVSRASGKLDGMRQFIDVPAFHTRLPVNIHALTQAQRFIEDGKFALVAKQLPVRKAREKARVSLRKH